MTRNTASVYQSSTGIMRLPRTIQEVEAMFALVPERTWGGSDGAISTAFPDGRIVWMFGDTITELDDFGGFRILYNSALVQLGSTLIVPERGKVQPVPNVSGKYYWPCGVTRWSDTQLLVCCLELQNPGPEQTNVRACLVTLTSDNRVVFDRWLTYWPGTGGVLEEWPDPGTNPIFWGEPKIDGSTLVVFGWKRTGWFSRSLYVATVPVANAETQASWTLGSTPIWATPEAAPGCSAWKDGTGWHVLTKKDHIFNDDLIVYDNDDLAGAWTRRVVGYSPEPAYGETHYAPHIHPEIPLENGKKVVSISRNWNRTFSTPARDFRPFYMELTI